MNNKKGNFHTGALLTTVDKKAFSGLVQVERTKPN
jgi:hypothetical protein